MDFEHSEDSQLARNLLQPFMRKHVLPRNSEWLHSAAEGVYPLRLLEALKAQAREDGL